VKAERQGSRIRLGLSLGAALLVASVSAYVGALADQSVLMVRNPVGAMFFAVVGTLAPLSYAARYWRSMQNCKRFLAVCDSSE
jgi:hypothetical protein